LETLHGVVSMAWVNITVICEPLITDSLITAVSDNHVPRWSAAPATSLFSALFE
jgi:hypothetical protein